MLSSFGGRVDWPTAGPHVDDGWPNMNRWPSGERTPSSRISRLVGRWFQDLSSGLDGPVVEGVDVIDAQIRNVAVITELPAPAWRRGSARA